LAFGQAMEEYRIRHLHGAFSIFDGAPASVGRIIHDVSEDDDLLEEMLP